MEYHTAYVRHQRFFIDKRYSNLKAIGQGSYGLVASAFDTVCERYVAIKKVKSVFQDLRSAQAIVRELILLRLLKGHENIISIVDIMSVQSNSYSSKGMEDVYIVTNLFEMNLERVIQSDQVLSDGHLKHILHQLLKALKHIHAADVLHRDLKPSNILVNSNSEIALCDFGMARYVEGASDDNLTEYVVSRWYRAPEVLCCCPSYGKPVDVWSVGCIFAELITRSVLFRGDNAQHQLREIVRKIGCPEPEKLSFIPFNTAILTILDYEKADPPPLRENFPPDTDPLAINLIRQMLQFHPAERISVQEALNHDYFRDYHCDKNDTDNTPSKDVIREVFAERSVKGTLNFSEKELRECLREEVKLYRDLYENESKDDGESLSSLGLSPYERLSKSTSSSGSLKDDTVYWLKRKF